jgi:hypothetical protein
MSWRLARGLEKLRSQVNARAPNRSKRSDGTIGDRAHASRASDHNPRGGIVHAWDCTHHPGVWDAHSFADRLLRSRDPRIKYLISNRRIGSAKHGWKWARYTGSNPHSGHLHISIHSNPHADNAKDWSI